MSKLYPIGIQNFESLRNDGYFYVDKTALLYRLAKTGRYFFLSRPRRFGKSLMISTLQAYFEGKKELFEGLAIEQLEKEWVKRPVLHIDLNIEKYNTPDSLDKILNDTLVQWEELYGTRLRKPLSPYGLPELSAVPAKKAVNVLPSLSTSTTSRCFRLSAT